MTRPTPFLLVVAIAAALGLFFAGFSTYDAVQHLDRDVHGLHCSFVPGLSGTDTDTSSGCHVMLMSPYSSVLRQRVWGGIPIALPAMSVFAFLLYWTLQLWVRDRSLDRRATGFLLAATLIPVGASAVMGTIAATVLHAACKLCIGIYVASALAFAGALAAWLHARRTRPDSPSEVSALSLALSFALGVAFVAAPISVYLAAMPDFSRFVGQCGSLEHPEDPYGVRIPMGGAGTVPAIEVLDPLCPACRAFEQRLDVSGLGARLRREVVLFPLDSTCNWMVSQTMHPGACAVSEAVLCAGADAPAVIAWALEEQEHIRSEASRDRSAAQRIVAARFPRLASCIGTAGARARLNRSLRWAVTNHLPVLTPQLYVNGTKLCDEDTDLGMDYALSRLLSRTPAGRP